ncbi:PilZ domain-containing protein [Leptospira ilyithenensis]|uniref:PilZ domain-containing protein n=1 Tax=Leptospira ilyithenensis TaxID=2484901 RepID=A0A4R9LQX2_9LEPT|nr:PilZ domain-containing protein [Leptospira ilyithenensis]TGN11921.1 PilZ domain-containing protein [Leptospira ilyithenensis]
MDKEITDIDGVLKVITALFGKLPVSIQYEGKDIPVKIIALKNKALIINTPLIFPNKDRNLSVVHNGSKFVAQFLLAGGDGHGIEILTPKKISIVAATRETTRVEVAPASGSNATLKAINIINVIDVSKAIGFDDKKVDAVLLTYRTKLMKAYPQSSIYFAGRMDNRLRLMHHYEKSIFIMDRKDKSSASPQFFPFDEYLRIFESSKIDDKYISEICIPIRYKGYVHLGYVQVLSENILTMEAFQQVEIFASAVARDVISTGVFQESREVCQVMDLSSGGISFLHSPSRSFSRSMTMNGTILFDIVFNQESRATFRGIIKNIRNQETNFRVGCQFYNLNPKDMEALDAFLSIGKPTELEPGPDASEEGAETGFSEGHDSEETNNPEENVGEFGNSEDPFAGEPLPE